MTINCIRELKNEFEHVKFNLDNSAEYNMYAREMEKAIKRAGFDLKKIYQLKDGRFKISTPFQCCKREKMKLFTKLPFKFPELSLAEQPRVIPLAQNLVYAYCNAV